VTRQRELRPQAMFDFLALVFGPRYWKLHSVVIRMVLTMRGIRIGKRFYIEGVPKLKLRGDAGNVTFGDNVSILGNIDLRNRENGRIIFRDNVTIERDCRFVSARDGTIDVAEGSIITAFAIINGGDDILIGRQCIIGPRASINANDHLFARDKPVREQGFTHAPVIIEDGCWLAANVVVNKGVRLARGTVVGAHSVVTKDTEEFGVYAGCPARKIADRP
jgi:acetyltransferase-like isoleucine patch superfamily enzyme